MKNAWLVALNHKHTNIECCNRLTLFRWLHSITIFNPNAWSSENYDFVYLLQIILFCLSFLFKNGLAHVYRLVWKEDMWKKSNKFWKSNVRNSAVRSYFYCNEESMFRFKLAANRLKYQSFPICLVWTFNMHRYYKSKRSNAIIQTTNILKKHNTQFAYCNYLHDS